MAAANINATPVAAATKALATAPIIGTDRSIPNGAIRRGRGATKQDREIYMPIPPASPGASQNGMYGGNGKAGGLITLYPVPERSGSGTDSYGSHAGHGHGAGSYGSVPSLSYPGGITSNGYHIYPYSSWQSSFRR